MFVAKLDTESLKSCDYEFVMIKREHLAIFTTLCIKSNCLPNSEVIELHYTR